MGGSPDSAAVVDAPDTAPTRPGPVGWLGRRAVRRVALGLWFVAAVVIMRRPTPRSLAEDLTANVGDPALVTWIMSWVSHAGLHHPLSLFDSPMFWPNDLTLAYSEVLVPLAPVYAVLHGVTGSWQLSHNLIALGLFVFAQAGAYLLAKRVTGRADAAVLAAFAFGFSGYALAHWGHTQLQTTGFLALAFVAALRAFERRTLGAGVLLGLASAATALASWYNGAAWVASLGAMVAGVVVLRRFRPGAGFVRMLVTAGLVAGVLVGPFALPYNELSGRPGFERDAPADWGLNIWDVFSPAVGSYAYEWVERFDRVGDHEHRFFPGLLTMALAGAGVVGLVATRPGRHRRRGPDRDASTGAGTRPRPTLGPSEATDLTARRREELLLLTLAGAVATVIALGPEMAGVPLPFDALNAFVPGFKGIRVPARLAIVALLAGACLAASGFARLTARLPKRTTYALVGLCLAVLTVELSATSPTMRLPDDDATLAVYRALDDLPRGPVVELPAPVPSTNPTGWAFVEACRAVYSTIDWNPRWNGYSGFMPVEYEPQAAVFEAFPSEASIRLARELGIRYVVLHGGGQCLFGMYTAEQLEARLDALPDGITATSHGDAWLVDIGTG